MAVDIATTITPSSPHPASIDAFPFMFGPSQQPAPSGRWNKTTLWTPSDIAYAVGQGYLIVVAQDRVYDLTTWAKHHPGGPLVLENMKGQQVWDQMRAMHPPEVLTTKVPHFCVGKLVSDGENDPNHQRHPTSGHHYNPTLDPDPKISAAFRAMEDYLQANGYYNTDYTFYWKNALKLCILFALAFLFLCMNSWNDWARIVPSALLLAAYWQQSAFVAHDAGHNGITHQRKYDQKIGILLGNILGGVSVGWWKKSHNIHHVLTNHPNHDPDIQHLPVMAIGSELLHGVYSTFHGRFMPMDAIGRVLIRLQHVLYYPIMCLARFNLYMQSFIFIAKDKHNMIRREELVGLFMFWTWYGATVLFLCPEGLLQKVAFVLLGNLSVGLLHVQITLSHFGMRLSMDVSEPFPKRMLETTMDVDCPPWLDWLHGGLQFQTIHHLFPRLPRHRLREVSAMVEKFANENGLHYDHMTFTRSNKHVLGKLREIAEQVTMLANPEGILKKD